MHEYIEQRIPGGSYAPQEQIDQALAVVREAAHFLELGEIDQIEAALENMRKPLVTLAAAGVLAGVTFQLRDEAGACGVTVAFDLSDVGDFEAVDLSRLRLLASPQGRGRLEIVCADVPLARQMVEGDLMPSLTEESLECCQVRWLGSEPAADVLGEDIPDELEEGGLDEYDDDGQGWGGSADEIDHVRD